MLFQQGQLIGGLRPPDQFGLAAWFQGFVAKERKERVFTNVPLQATEVVRIVWMEIEQQSLAHSDDPGDQVDT